MERERFVMQMREIWHKITEYIRCIAAKAKAVILAEGTEEGFTEEQDESLFEISLPLAMIPEETSEEEEPARSLNDIIRVIRKTVPREKLQYVDVEAVARQYQRKLGKDETLSLNGPLHDILSRIPDPDWKKVTVLIYAPCVIDSARWMDAMIYYDKIVKSIKNLLDRVSGDDFIPRKTAYFLGDCYINHCGHGVMPNFKYASDSDYIPSFGTPETWMALCDSIVANEKGNDAVSMAGGFYRLVNEALQTC